MDNCIKKIVIAGGGTAGWIAAAVLGKSVGHTIDIVLVESDDIPTVGVGEATIPPLLRLHEILKIDERQFVSEVNGAFKLGIQFENWRENGHKYFHSFGYAGKDSWACQFIQYWLGGKEQGIEEPYEKYVRETVAAMANKFAVVPKSRLNYAYHMDAGRYASFLRQNAESNGVARIEGKIEYVEVSRDDGFISSLRLQSGEVVDGDFFIDCTGFRALLIEGALNAGFDDWTHWLPCDRAIAVQTPCVSEPVPYVRSIAHDWGWRWRIPLQTRVGNGIVYSSKFVSDDEALNTFLKNLEGDPITEPKPIRFRTGTRRQHWKKNCLAVGLASGFLEPLESTSIHLIQQSIVRFVQLFPSNGVEQCVMDEFNNQTKREVERIRDFIILHYKVTNREDTEFWRHCKNMDIPDELRRRIELFSETGRAFKIEGELFAEESWMQVMMGQGIMPSSYHPAVHGFSEEQLKSFLEKLRTDAQRLTDKLPSHQEFIDYYCKTVQPESEPTHK